MPNNPNIALSLQPVEFSLDAFQRSRARAFDFRRSLGTFEEEERQRAADEQVRQAFRKRHGGAPGGLVGPAPLDPGPGQAAPPARGLGGEAPFPPLAEQEAQATQQALYGPAASPLEDRGGPVPPGPQAQTLEDRAGASTQGPVSQTMGGRGLGAQAPGQNAFIRELYTIDPKAGREAEKHAYESRKLELANAKERVEHLGRVADGVLAAGTQEAWNVGRAMLIEDGMPESQVPVTYDPKLLQMFSGMARTAAERLREGELDLDRQKYQFDLRKEGRKVPDYGLGADQNALAYDMFGSQLAPGQPLSPTQVQEVRRRYLATDPAQRLKSEQALREEEERKALEGVRDVEPGAPTMGTEGAAATGLPQSYLQMEPTTKARVDAAVQQAARRHGLDPSELYGLMGAESDFSPQAKSPKGAIGLMQLMPDTAKQLGVDPSTIEGNIAGGAAYYAQQKRRFGGDVARARAAYNAGPEAVEKYGGVPPFAETKEHGARTERLTRRFAGQAGSTADGVQVRTEDAGERDPMPPAAPGSQPGPALGSSSGAGPYRETGAGVRPQRAAGEAAPGPASGAGPASPKLAADTQRLRRLEERREAQEAHNARLSRFATSEAGSKRLQQGERVLSRLNGEIDTLRTRLYEQGPESLERKKAIQQAGIESALDKPLSSEDAALYGMPPGTTVRELGEMARGERPPIEGTLTPLKGAAAETYQMGARMNRSHEAVAALEEAGITNAPFLTTLENTAAKLTGAIGTVVGVAAGGGFAGATAGGGAGLGVGSLATPLVNALRTPEQRRYVTAQLAFIAGILRKESGAAVTAEEYRQYSAIFFPQAADDADTIAAKRAMRLEEIASLQEQFPNRPFPGAPAATTKVRPQAEREPGILTPRPSERPKPGQRGWPYQPGGAILD